MSTATKSRPRVKPVPVDPATLWNQSKRILFAVARKVRKSVRLKLEGHGRGQAEAEELVNDAFIALMEALPRFNPATAKLTTFAYGLARRRMWLVARAEFYGVTPEQLHRMDAAKRSPRYHGGERTLRGVVTPAVDSRERESVGKADAIRQGLPFADNCLIGMWLQESGNVSEVARRLDCDRTGIQGRYHRLFRRIRRATI